MHAKTSIITLITLPILNWIRLFQNNAIEISNQLNYTLMSSHLISIKSHFNIFFITGSKK